MILPLFSGLLKQPGAFAAGPPLQQSALYLLERRLAANDPRKRRTLAAATLRRSGKRGRYPYCEAR